MEYFSFDFESNRFYSPGYLRCTLPEQVKKEVQNTIKKIDEGEIEVYDNRHNLAGHLQKETWFPVTEKLNYLVKSLCVEYKKIFSGEYRYLDQYHPDFIQGYVEKGYNFEYILRDLWINYGKKHDFNPVHNHTGTFSFVLWVKIPYKFEDEKKVYPFAKGQAGTFEFIHPNANNGSGLGQSKINTVEWDLILFPSTLAHTVYPFYTSDDERISIAGNLYLEPVEIVNK